MNNFWQAKIDQSTLEALGKIEWGALTPAWVGIIGVLIVLLADLLLPKSQKSAVAWLSFLVVVVAIVGAFLFMDTKASAFQNMVAADEMSRYMAVIIFGAAAVMILASPDYLARIGLEARGEYYSITLAAAVGMWLLAVSINFITFFIALEIFSISLYILAGFLPRSTRSHEAGFKYFLLSSFASAIMLYGMALIFGATGSTGYGKILEYLTANGISGDKGWLVLFGMAMIAVGFAFKISAVPFHLWTPDVYEGSPTPVTALMAVGTKAAIIAAFIRTFGGAFEPIRNQWQPLLWVLAATTMIIGNFLAVSQNNVKRLLAYSAVAQAGYLLVGIAVDTDFAREAVLYYILTYSVVTLGAFTVVMALEGPRGEGQDLRDFGGIAKTNPWLAAVMALCLLSLGGIPPTAGFFGKALVFASAIELGGWWLALALIGIVTSLIAIFYYFRIVIAMYMGVDSRSVARKAQTGRPAWSLGIVVILAGIGSILLGIFAGSLVQWAQTAAVLGAR
jgi:NADH-quinone oxidoreductase subunit N